MASPGKKPRLDNPEAANFDNFADKVALISAIQVEMDQVRAFLIGKHSYFICFLR